jgi:hypothetical protein
VEHVFLRRPGTPAHATVWPPPRRITVLRPAEGAAGLRTPAGQAGGGEWSPVDALVELEADQVGAPLALGNVALCTQWTSAGVYLHLSIVTLLCLCLF